jgi:CDP-diacylglycerol--glycerol-3-phosphate 3-phosphatidyltransferase/cardiolipin synthase
VPLESRPISRFRRLPDILSLSRLLLAALFVPAGRTGRLALIVIAAATDFLDGWIARRTHTGTRLGALVDPLGDRLFVLVVIVTYVVNGGLSVLEALLLLSRDLATALGFLAARAVPTLRAVEFKARFPGKLVTVLQLVTLLALVAGAHPMTPFIALVTLASAIAVADYASAMWRDRAR